MRISIADAGGRLGELVRRTEAGDEVILTRDGQPVARFVPVAVVASNGTAKRKFLETLRAAGRAKAAAGPSAARSQDFLYGRG